MNLELELSSSGKHDFHGQQTLKELFFREQCYIELCNDLNEAQAFTIKHLCHMQARKYF